MEETGSKVIHNAPTTPAVKGRAKVKVMWVSSTALTVLSFIDPLSALGRHNDVLSSNKRRDATGLVRATTTDT